MSDMLAIGASGLRAYQVALATVSENIANAGTAGYSRRTTNIKEVASIGAVGAQSTGSGEGAAVTGVQRAGDMFKQAEVLVAGADLAKTETSVTWLDRIETSMSGSVLGTRLSSFFTSATTLAGDPTSTAARSAMLESANGVASAFSETGASLDRVSADLDTTTRDTVSSLNSLAATLAKINNGLGRTGEGTAGNAALLDQRDQVLDQMSALTDVTVDYDRAGRATVRAGGSGGPVLVDTSQASTVGYSRNAAGTITFNMMSGIDQHVLSPVGGALAGIVDGAQRIADARSRLQGIAQNFVDGINAVQAQGRDLDNNSGAALFAIDPSQGTAQVSVALDDPRGIAASAVGGGQRDNTNLGNFTALRTSGDYENKVVDMTTTNASALAQRKSVADAQTTIRSNAVASRDSLSGVDLDSEAVDLMRFQQAYAATSRVIQVARDTIQSIIDIR
ncbi:flagellar hook-associated protein FlgK [Sphingomonas sp.]|jgi:flagellar hook-associated protein 1 FlgK|uniref:flagellar hook-associated protein FlgK n=1 Tax=Sphingomonas sp. TaxID=28214 RepID=UPI002E37D1A7|nr:flagellar hook-associated protein FlgK [Sphingomonas sp.]HEX4694570.1 flagellar hook-associated protein FlgK [Sphingomonas sp.]